MQTKDADVKKKAAKGKKNESLISNDRVIIDTIVIMESFYFICYFYKN